MSMSWRSCKCSMIARRISLVCLIGFSHGGAYIFDVRRLVDAPNVLDRCIRLSGHTNSLHKSNQINICIVFNRDEGVRPSCTVAMLLVCWAHPRLEEYRLHVSVARGELEPSVVNNLPVFCNFLLVALFSLRIDRHCEHTARRVTICLEFARATASPMASGPSLEEGRRR